MICATCLTALDLEVLDGNERWVHALAQKALVPGVAGHEPVPIPNDSFPEHRYKCDFCFAADPAWVYPCETFDMDDYGIEMGSSGDWGACDECRAIIDGGELDKLVYRVMHESPVYTGFKGYQRDRMTAMLTVWLRRFMEHRMGVAHR